MQTFSRAITALLTALPGAAFSAAIIGNGTVLLGVDDYGQLNVSGGPPSPVEGTTQVGLRYLPTGNESTAHGCLCEGWGVGIADDSGTRIASGSANNDIGVRNLDLAGFSSTARTATSSVQLLSDTGAPLLEVTHSFAPAPETANLYRVEVSIENIGGTDVADLRYTRTFDWDVEPDSFQEVVTHIGTAAAGNLLLAINNGFVDSDPFASGRDPTLPGGVGDFVDLGPDDQGSNFDFGFGALAAGETLTFEIFYGAADTEATALTVLGLVDAEVVSLGQAASDPLGLGGDRVNTFMFAFAGVGGGIPGVPVPGTLWLMGVALLAFGARRACAGRPTEAGSSRSSGP